MTKRELEELDCLYLKATMDTDADTYADHFNKVLKADKAKGKLEKRLLFFWPKISAAAKKGLNSNDS